MGAKAVVFFTVLTATAVILWLNGWLAVRFARRQPTQALAASAWNPTGNAPPPDLLALMRDRLPWPRVIAGSAGYFALLAAAGEAGNWGVYLQFFYHVPYGAYDPLYNNDIRFYLSALPAYILTRNSMLLVVVGCCVLSNMAPVLFRHFFVKPTELQLEKPYIERNIALTRQAYNLDQIAAKPFAAEQKLTFRTLEANKATIENIRLWDWLPLSDTYAQLQEIRTYYKFHDLDVDRYWLDGSYQSVMLSARELRSSLLPPNAQTWVNRHVLFTHGNGAVMSPVTRKSTEGLPFLYLRDIPPVADGGPKIHEPRIYYGEESDSYVIVKGSTPEFDYPKGKDNVYAAYDGTGGVPIGAMVWRGLFAYYFNDPNLLLSSYITTDSRIMIRRNIQERVRTIAPFLRLDHDPYLVISSERMFWMQDAYTTSSYFPSAQPAQDLDLNYIRNSVKVVVDAYNGTVDFYLMDPGDPIAATYQRIFQCVFTPFP